MERPRFLQGESITRLVQGAAIGAVATMIIGFGWGGWVVGSTAQKQADAAVENAMIRVCADKFLGLGADVQAEYKKADSYNRDEVVSKYIKSVGGASVDYSLAHDCAALIDKRSTTTAAK